MIHLKLAEIRKKSNITQRELADALSISHQTISKWENGVVTPDITMLPLISKYFNVSVDALLGLVPLEEGYKPSDSGTKKYWSERLEYLKRTRKLIWNEDYMEFLIKSVWKIDQPITVLDCGCGYGSLGLLMLPLLPTGSKYVGIDFTEEMIMEAKQIFAGLPYHVDFTVADIMEFEPKERYDMVISQSVLRHVNNGEVYIRKMTEFLKEEGIVVSIECNREFEEAGLNIEGLDYGSLCEHDGLRKLWKIELEKQNRDYSIAMKIPFYMKKAGLINVDCRMNDKILFLEPERWDYEEYVDNVILTDYWKDEKSPEEMEKEISYFMNHGMNRREPERYWEQKDKVGKYLVENKGQVSLVKVMGYMISYGYYRG